MTFLFEFPECAKKSLKHNGVYRSASKDVRWSGDVNMLCQHPNNGCVVLPGSKTPLRFNTPFTPLGKLHIDTFWHSLLGPLPPDTMCFPILFSTASGSKQTKIRSEGIILMIYEFLRQGVWKEDTPLSPMTLDQCEGFEEKHKALCPIAVTHIHKARPMQLWREPSWALLSY